MSLPDELAARPIRVGEADGGRLPCRFLPLPDRLGRRGLELRVSVLRLKGHPIMPDPAPSLADLTQNL